MFSRWKSNRPAPAAERWRTVSIRTTSAGEDLAFLRLSGEREGAHIVPMFVADFVEYCDSFRALEEHLSRFAEYMDWTHLEAEALQSWLPQLQEWGVFVEERELINRVAGHASAARPPCALASIGVPTANRPEMLARVLASFSANLEKHGRHLPFVVADSSRDPATSVANAQVAQEARERRVDVRFFDRAAKEDIIERLTLASGVRREVLEFALLDPENCGFTCGVNRNLILLLHAGRAFACVDDDVTCDFARPETPVEGLTLFAASSPEESRYFGSRREVYESVERAEGDFVGLHQRLLGRSPAEAIADFSAVKAAGVSEEFIRRLQTGDPRVRMSFAGHFGDSTLYSSCYQLFANGRNFARLIESEERYEASINSRSSAVVMPGWSIGDTSSTPGMAMALDATEILPPFFPVFHLEDVAFGGTMRICASGALTAHFPLAIRHDPAVEARPIRPVDLPEVPAVIFEFAQLFKEVQSRFQEAPGPARPEVTMVQLGQYLEALAAVAPDDFDEYLKQVVLESAGGAARGCDRLIGARGAEADFWARDIERWREHLRQSMTGPDFDIPRELQGNGRSAGENRRLIQRIILRYGQLLQAWPAIWRAAVSAEILRENPPEAAR